MTRVLPSGIEAKTGHVPMLLAPRLSLAERHYVVLGHNIMPFVGIDGEAPKTRMIDAVFALRDAFEDPAIVADPIFQQFKKYLSTYEIKVDRWEPGPDEKDLPVIRYRSSSGEGFTLDYDEPGPTITLLDNELTRNDLIEFTTYLFENSAPEGLGDARTSLLETLRAAND